MTWRTVASFLTIHSLAWEGIARTLAVLLCWHAQASAACSVGKETKQVEQPVQAAQRGKCSCRGRWGKAVLSIPKLYGRASHVASAGSHTASQSLSLDITVRAGNNNFEGKQTLKKKKLGSNVSILFVLGKIYHGQKPWGLYIYI